jgi:peptidoglycan/LPS O-acetylase OafA/YrhL
MQVELEIRKEVPFSLTTASVLLDALRAIAALLVVVDHWRNFFFVDYPQITAHKVLFGALYLFAAAGHQAVIVFFILSGYLIGGSIRRSVQRGTWSWSQYLTHRLVRLWIVLIPALLLGAFWDHLGLWLHRSPALYAGLIPNEASADVLGRLSLRTFFGNVLFLQTILTPTFGSNGALWSLANEWWYYMMFPLIMSATRAFYKPSRRILFAGVFLVVAFAVGKVILISFPIWLLGALLNIMPRARVSLRFRVAATFLYSLIFFAVCAVGRGMWGREHAMTIDYGLSFVTFGYIWILLSASEEAGQGVAARAARAVARFSYTMYATHIPLLLFLAGLLAGNTRWFPGTSHVLLALGTFALTLAYSWVVASVTEFRTDSVRCWVESRVQAIAQSAA